MNPDNSGVSIVPTADDRGMVVCNLCEAVEDGNATCWACVDRWGWARGNQWHTDLVALLRTRAPGPPMIEADVDAFIRKISERAPDEADAALRVFPRGPTAIQSGTK